MPLFTGLVLGHAQFHGAPFGHALLPQPASVVMHHAHPEAELPARLLVALATRTLLLPARPVGAPTRRKRLALVHLGFALLDLVTPSLALLATPLFLGHTTHGKVAPWGCPQSGVCGATFPPFHVAVTPISLGTFFGSEIGKYPAIDLGDCEFILHLDRAGILANPCNPWEIRVSRCA